MTKRLRGARVAGATVLALCLAWCCASCGRLPSAPGLKSAPCPAGGAAGHGNAVAGRVAARSSRSGGRRVVWPPPARQLWASTLRGPELSPVAEALSPDGTRLFVLGLAGPAVKSETIAYSTATGARLWATTYPPEFAGHPGNMIAVSPDGTQVYVTVWGGPYHHRL